MFLMLFRHHISIPLYPFDKHLLFYGFRYICILNLILLNCKLFSEFRICESLMSWNDGDAWSVDNFTFNILVIPPMGIWQNEYFLKYWFFPKNLTKKTSHCPNS
jgi:hypothetical protein